MSRLLTLQDDSGGFEFAGDAFKITAAVADIDDLKTVPTSSLPKISHEPERLQQRWTMCLVDDVSIASVIAFCDEAIHMKEMLTVAPSKIKIYSKTEVHFFGLQIARNFQLFQ